MLSALALTALLGADVHVAVELKSPLRLDAAGVLRGVIVVRVENRGADSVELEHPDVHGFRLVPRAGGPDALIIHTCDCGFVLGLETPPEGRRFTLAPGQTRVLTFDDFTCSGGPFRTPPPGRYHLRYYVTPPSAAPTHLDAGFDLERCVRALESLPPQAVESAPVPVELLIQAKHRRSPRR
jgi:hypothetical protein